MTDKEIIKGLECCIGYHECSKCPYNSGAAGTSECMSECMSDALDLINRQKAENERLKDLNAVLETDNINANMNLEHITYEFGLLEQEKSVIQVEAIKDFAERFKKQYAQYDEYDELYVKTICFDIDCTVEEMIGEQE